MILIDRQPVRSILFFLFILLFFTAPQNLVRTFAFSSSKRVDLFQFAAEHRLQLDYDQKRESIRLTGNGKWVEIYLTMPYLRHGDQIYYFFESPVRNEKGALEIPVETAEAVVRLLELEQRNTVQKEEWIHPTEDKEEDTAGEDSRKQEQKPEETEKSGTGDDGDGKDRTQTNQQTETVVPVEEKRKTEKDTEEEQYKPAAEDKAKSAEKKEVAVVLDAGHGGKDPGGLGIDGTKEKKLVLSITYKVMKILKNQGLNVYLTRGKDEYVSLKDRTVKANQLAKEKETLFASIHCNISLNSKVHGIEIYTLADRASDETSLSLEAAENAGFSEEDIRKTEALYAIIGDLYRDAFKEDSIRMAQIVGNAMKNSTGAKYRGEKKANFYVLKYNYMPSILIEAGFMSNKDELKKLVDDDYQNRIAEGIAEGILRYLKTK